MLSAEGSSQPERPLVLWLRDGCGGNYRSMPMQQIAVRDDDDRPNFPKLRQLGVKGQSTPVDLPDSQRRNDPWLHAGRGVRIIDRVHRPGTRCSTGRVKATRTGAPIA